MISNPMRGRDLNQMLPSMKVEHFIDNEHRCWRENLVRLFFLEDCCRHILTIHILNFPCEDKLVWRLVKSGEYSVKSGYKQALLRYYPYFGHPDTNQMVWKKLWHLRLLPKWALFIWKFLHRIFPVKWDLKRQGMIDETVCVGCNKKDETLEHVFFDSTISQRVWRGSVLVLDFSMGSPVSFFRWFKDWVEQVNDDLRAGL
ncbi:unnamed protein product [Camellia sinensis]